MSAGAIKAGEAFVRIWANDKEAQQTFRDMQSRMKSFAAEAASLGMGVSAMGAAMSAPFAVALKTFTSFSDQMARVKAVSGATDEQFARLTKTAQDLGATTSFTARQVADGLGYLAMAGYNAEQAMAGIPAVLNLAKAGALDLGRAADIATDIGTAFGMSADEISRVGDVLAKASTISNTNVEMMGTSFQYAAAAANASGQSLEEMAASMAILAGNGIKANMAGTGLRSMLTDLVNPSKAAQEVLDRLGISIKNDAGAMRPLLDIVESFKTATAGMDQVDRMSDIFAVFGDRGGTSAMALMSAAGEEVARFRNELNNAGGTAQKISDIMGDTLGGSLKMLESALEAVSIEVGKTLAPLARDAIDAGTAFLGFANSIVEAAPGAVKLAAGVAVATAALGAGTLAMAGMAKAGSVAVGAYQGYAKAVLGVKEALTDKAAAEDAAAKSTAALAEYQKQAEAAARQKADTEKKASAIASDLSVSISRLADAEAKLEQARYKSALATGSRTTTDTQLANAARSVENAQTHVAKIEATVASQRAGLASATEKARIKTDEYAQAVTRLGYAELQAQSGANTVPGRFASAANAAKNYGASLSSLAKCAASAAGSVAILSGAVASVTDDDDVKRIASGVSAAASAVTAFSLLSGSFVGAKAAAVGLVGAIGGGLVVALGAAVAAGAGLALWARSISKDISTAEKAMREAEGSANALGTTVKILNDTKNQGGVATLAALEKERKALEENTKEMEKQLEVARQRQRGFGVIGDAGEVAAAKQKLEIHKENIAGIDREIAKQKELNKENNKSALDALKRANESAKAIKPVDDGADADDGRKQLLRVDPESVKPGLDASIAEVTKARQKIRAEHRILVSELAGLELIVTKEGAGGTANQREMISTIAKRMNELSEEDKRLADSLTSVRENMEEAGKAVLKKNSSDAEKALKDFKEKSLSNVDASRQEASNDLVAAAARLDIARDTLSYVAQKSVDGTLSISADELRGATEEYDLATQAFDDAQKKMASTNDGFEMITRFRKELDDLQRADRNREDDRDFAKLTKSDPFKAAQTASAHLEAASREYVSTIMDFQGAIERGDAAAAERLRDIVSIARTERDRAQERADGFDKEDDSSSGEVRGTFSAEAARRMGSGGGAVDVAKQQLDVEKQIRDKLDKINDKISSSGGLGA